MKKIALLLSLALASSLNAQLLFSWASSYTTVCQSRGLCVTMEASNCVINAGTYLGTGDFNGNPVNFSNLSTPGTPGVSDMYINKVDNNNANFFWARRIRGTGAEIPTDIACNGTGTIYVVGFFNGTCQFDPAWVVPPTASVAGSNDIFIARYSSATGNYLGETVIGGPGEDRASAVFIEPTGNILVCGRFTGVVNFNPAGVFNLGVAGDTNAFFARYSSTGAFVNAWMIGGARPELAMNITEDASNNILVCGSFSSLACDFDPGVGATAINATSAYVPDVFVAKYTNSGAFTWVRTFGTGDIDQGADVVTDPANNVYLTGTLGTLGTGFGTTGDIDPGTAGVQSITNPGTISGRSDIFLLRFSPLGTLNWSRVIGSNTDDIAMSINTDPAITGWVYVTGAFTGTVDFAAGGGFPLTSAGLQDIYIMRYSYAGAFGTASRIGAAGDDGAWDSCVDTLLNKVFVTGQFQNTVDFDPNAGIQNRTAPVFPAMGNFLAAYDWTTLPPRLAGPSAINSPALVPFPNPNNGTFAIENVPEGTIAEVYSPEGKMCAREVAAVTGYWALDLSALVNGVYMIQLTQPGGTVSTEKIVIHR